MQPFVINIGRQLGSGGRAIGRLLAKDLGINYYDREILLLAAKESGFTPEIFERSDEKNHFLRTLGNIIPFVGGSESFYNNELSNETCFAFKARLFKRQPMNIPAFSLAVVLTMCCAIIRVVSTCSSRLILPTAYAAFRNKTDEKLVFSL